MFTSVRLGSNFDFTNYVVRSQISPMNDWYDGNGCGLYRKLLDNAIYPTYVGFLAYSSVFVNKVTMKKLIN